MATGIPLALREVSDELQRAPSPAMSMASRPPLVGNRLPFWIAVAILGAVALAWVLPPASSYRVATTTPQWITGL